MNLSDYSGQDKSDDSNNNADGVQAAKKKGKKQEEMEKLKREMEMDEHSISMEELCARFESNIERVCTRITFSRLNLHHAFRDVYRACRNQR